MRPQTDSAESQKTEKDMVLNCRPKGTHIPSGKNQRSLQGFSKVRDDVLKSLYVCACEREREKERERERYRIANAAPNIFHLIHSV